MNYGVMKTVGLRTGLVAALLAIACQGQLFNVRVSGDATTTVPARTALEQLVGDFGFGEFVSMDLTESQELQNQGVEPGDIASARLVRFDLEAIDPDDADLSFLDSMSIYVEAPDLPRVLLATASEFPEGEAVVEFELTGEDIADHVVSQSMTFSTEVNGRRPTSRTEVLASYAVRVGVTGQGACAQTRRGD
ncbi:MAG: hypothetical protein EA397_04510 [Deltaproteobacteria bacterium]|nr:MAG: hypothetical protein EA397_04510 [Deltaproteobacteria bacterium]